VHALDTGRTWLEADEVGKVLVAYGIPFATPRVAANPDTAASAAAALGFPVALKICEHGQIVAPDAEPLSHGTLMAEMQVLGGFRAGTAWMSLGQQLRGGIMKRQAAEELARLGLIGPPDEEEPGRR
jgi:hypothetical protein